MDGIFLDRISIVNAHPPGTCDQHVNGEETGWSHAYTIYAIKVGQEMRRDLFRGRYVQQVA